MVTIFINSKFVAIKWIFFTTPKIKNLILTRINESIVRLRLFDLLDALAWDQFPNAKHIQIVICLIDKNS